jgi:hypothetical protein
MGFDNQRINQKKQALYNAYLNAEKVKNSAPIINPKKMTLAGPMISRVYKAKPGCSACGK